ncbi:shikimate dehydrogenase [Orrella daihaiensis]|uniref:Shikimate dehydrogenase (NADP(+)) n=1 Tax=Orrella daihaiensis TaxID=2782176 RepID=A0ABY4AIS6_9BURK|nr:shikimate dehydrogenase [Orrella daihaiensis]UOD50187.1 shikimate dehydrogenase [Orrella daihaiensis]
MTKQPILRFAVIGHPVAHSRSPDIHAAFAAEVGVNLIYDRLDCEPHEFETRVQKFFDSGGTGLNVTVPFKERAWQLARQNLSERAQQAGAVNTLWMANGQLHGCNTDGVGLINDLKRLSMPIKDARILLIGAGGAARGVIGPLLEADCQHLLVVNRTAARADELVDDWLATHAHDSTRLSANSLSALGQANLHHSKDFDLIVNATASSLQGDPLPLPASLFGPSVAAYDMMYGRGLTTFLRQANEAGSTELADGLGMLVGQAAESFRIWLSKSPNVEPVITEIRAQLESAVR